MDLQLAGKTALVTGASMGIGRAIAKALAAEGVRVVAVARRIELIRAMADEVEALHYPRPAVLVQDLMEEDAAARLREAAVGSLGRVDILVNNAGGSRVLPIDAPDERWAEAMTLNFTRPRQLAHALLPGMIDNLWGRIINITGKSEPEHLNAAFSRQGWHPCVGEGIVAGGRTIRRHGQLDRARPHHERADPPQLPGRLSKTLCRDRDSGSLLGRAGGPGCDGGLVGVAACPLRHRHGHSSGRRAAAISVLIGRFGGGVAGELRHG
jgi:short chain dehydrogenase